MSLKILSYFWRVYLRKKNNMPCTVCIKCTAFDVTTVHNTICVTTVQCSTLLNLHGYFYCAFAVVSHINWMQQRVTLTESD
jgi:hypothetical protein